MPEKQEKIKEQAQAFTNAIDKLAKEYNAEIVVVADFLKSEEKRNSIIHFSGFVLEDYNGKKKALNIAIGGYCYKNPEIRKLEIM
jgi:hypothetical protein